MTSGSANERTTKWVLQAPCGSIYISNGCRDKSTGKRLLLEEFLRVSGSQNLETQALFFCSILKLHSPLSVALCHCTCNVSSGSGRLSGYKGNFEIIL